MGERVAETGEDLANVVRDVMAGFAECNDAGFNVALAIARALIEHATRIGWWTPEDAYFRHGPGPLDDEVPAYAFIKKEQG